MTTETRPRWTSDGDRDDRRYGGRAERGYGAYTSGANALRIDSIFTDEDFEPPQWSPRARPVSRTGASAADRTTAAARATTGARSTTTARSGTAARATTVDGAAAGRTRQRTASEPTSRRSATTGRPAVAPAPRPGRARRLPWLNDVTGEHPMVAPARPLAEPAPALPLPRAPFAVLMVVLVVLGVVGVLVLNTKINEDSFRLADLRSDQAALDLQEQQLRQQLADLESPGNLRAAAIRLGLVPAGDPAFINLPEGRVVGDPQPAPAR
jgi:hypothetical protein